MLDFILSRSLWILIATLALPSTLIVVSWEAVPGDSTYKIKVGLEQAALGVAPSDNLKSLLQIKYTERRFNEVQKVLATDHAAESINNFDHQLIASKNSVQEIKNVEQKQIQAQQLIKTLENVSQRIEQDKQALVSSSAPPSQVVATNPSPKPATSIPTSPPQVIIHTNPPAKPPLPTLPPQPTAVSNPPSAPATAEQLNKTEEKIQEVIKELKKSQNQEEKDKDKDKEKDKDKPGPPPESNSPSPENQKDHENNKEH